MTEPAAYRPRRHWPSVPQVQAGRFRVRAFNAGLIIENNSGNVGTSVSWEELPLLIAALHEIDRLSLATSANAPSGGRDG